MLSESFASMRTESVLLITMLPLRLMARTEVTIGCGMERWRAMWFGRPGVAFFSRGDATQLAGSSPGSEKLIRSSELPRNW